MHRFSPVVGLGDCHALFPRDLDTLANLCTEPSCPLFPKWVTTVGSTFSNFVWTVFLSHPCTLLLSSFACLLLFVFRVRITHPNLAHLHRPSSAAYPHQTRQCGVFVIRFVCALCLRCVRTFRLVSRTRRSRAGFPCFFSLLLLSIRLTRYNRSNWTAPLPTDSCPGWTTGILMMT